MAGEMAKPSHIPLLPIVFEKRIARGILTHHNVTMEISIDGTVSPAPRSIPDNMNMRAYGI